MRRWFSLIVAIFLTARCATIAHGRSQTIAVTSNPPGAAAVVACGDRVTATAITPAELTVRRSDDHCSLTLRLSGYIDQTIALRRVRSGVVWLNAIPAVGLGFLFGAATAVGSLMDDSSDAANRALAAGAAIGGAVSFLIDQRTGALYEFQPRRIDVTLQPATE